MLSVLSLRRLALLPCALGVLLALPARGQADDTLEVVHSFDVRREPYEADAALIRGSDGNLYGTTHGANGADGSYGTIYRLGTDGTFAILYTFKGADGAAPGAALLQTSDGSFYGTTSRGGPADQGTVFHLTPDGTLTTLHSFSADQDGSSPSTALIEGRDGNFYGTTIYGGTYNRGTVFRLTPDGTLTTLHSFSVDHEDGSPGGSGLVQASDGNFYGMTSFNNGYGAIYRMTPDGTLTILHHFATYTDGAFPVGTLVQGRDGNLYGVTSSGGTGNNCNGMVFRMTLDGTVTILHAFTTSQEGYSPDGQEPATGVIQGSDGAFYGTTSTGFDNDSTSFGGTVFRLAPDGTLTTLHKFTQPYMSGGSSANLAEGGDGLLYGVTSYGGASNYGTVFRVTKDSVAPVAAPVSRVPVVYGTVIRSSDLADTEPGGFRLALSATQTTDFKVFYKITGTARPGVDYVAMKGVAKIKAGKGYKTINLFPIAIPPVAGQEKTVRTAKLTIQPGEGYYVDPEFKPLKLKITHP